MKSEMPLVGELRDDGGRIVAVLDPRFFQRETLVEEFSRRVVVVQREAHAGDAVIVRRKVDQRNGGLFLGAAEIADLDGERFRGRALSHRGPRDHKLRHRKLRHQGQGHSTDHEGAPQTLLPISSFAPIHL